MSKIIYKNYSIAINNSDYQDDPRKFNDYIGSLALYHKRYTLAKEDNLTIDEAYEIESSNNYICLPVYGYDHGGLTVSTSKFSCPYDSGKLGITYVSKEKLKVMYNVKRISNKLKNKIIEYLENELAEYNCYLTGDIYDIIIYDAEDNELDSFSGFYGYDRALAEAQSYIDSRTEYDEYIAKKLPMQLSLPLY